MKQLLVRWPRKLKVVLLIVAALLVAGVGSLAALGGSESGGDSKAVSGGSGGSVMVQEAPAAQQRAEAPAGSDLAVAEALQNAFGAAAAKALPVVVEVDVTEVVRQNTTRSVSPFDFFFGQTPGGQGGQGPRQRQGLGSGVIVGRDGSTVYVLTNDHVVGSASDIQIKLNDGREFTGKRVGTDPRIDLALVSFTTKDEVPIAVLADSSKLRVGDWVIAVGNPYGFESSVTAGIVSALGRHAEGGSGVAQLTDYIQTDASINSGNSGGALLNLRGEVVGINSWIASQSGGSIGIGFAIPINNAKGAIKDFIQSGKVVYGWLGVSITDANQQALPGVAEDLKLGNRAGSFVINVYKGSPADKGGLLPGDYVVKAGDTVIQGTQQLTEVVARVKPGSDLILTVLRQGVEQKLTVKITERPAEDRVASQDGLWPGMAVLPLSDAIRGQLSLPQGSKGLVVASVDERSAAGVAGVSTGDLVLNLNGAKVGTVAEFYKALNDNKSREVSLQLQRQGRELTLTFQK